MEKDSKKVVQQWFDSYNQKDRDAYAEVIADDILVHGVNQDIQGFEGVMEATFSFDTFPDAKYIKHDEVAEGNKVANRSTFVGTHEGEYRGIEPTGKKVEVPVMSIVRIEGGKIVEEWSVIDRLELMQQLGVVDLLSDD
ncbi:MAG: ester cyclase [Halobacteria archaeon]|nr:ester cyclase [Halobacteria archaeon]